MTGARCAHCPATEGLSCRGGVFCAWAAAGDPVHLRHIAAVALRDAGRPTPPQAAVPCQDATPQPAPTQTERLTQLPPAEVKPCCGGQPPGLLTKVTNFAKAAFEHVAAGMPAADAATVEARWATCRACEMFDAASVVCRVCGCRLSIKIRMREERCPIGKW